MVWIVYGQAKTWKVPPSSLLGLKPGSYEAFCLDQAVNYFGSYVEGELDKVGEKQSAKTRRTQQDRERKLKQLLEPPEKTDRKGQFMDPAVFFQ